jgi:hypothetical protein
MTMMSAFGTDRAGLSQEAMMGMGRSGFSHPLMGMGMGLPMCGQNMGMGMVPGMNPMMGGMGGMMQNNMMLQMMMMMLQMMMMMMQQGGMGGPGMGMPGMGMPGMGFPGGFGNPLSMGMPSCGGGGGFGGPCGLGGPPLGMAPRNYGPGVPGGAIPHGVPNTGAPAGTNFPPINLAGNEAALASNIDRYLASKGSPAAGQNAGAMFVKYGKEYNVDPLVLLAISQHETGHGRLGVGVRKMLGVGAFDANPGGRTKFDGLENQIMYGAKTFARLRAKGGAGAGSGIGDQIMGAGRGGWASDGGWARKVIQHYGQIRGTVSA